jgi:hypothetical protein
MHENHEKNSEEMTLQEHVKTQNSVHQQMYPMVYTFAEADRLNGYASGMPYVNYYEQIWTQLLRQKNSVYNLTALDLLSRLTRKLREGHEHISTSDAIEAYSMVQGLAGLRGKREGGVYELMDATLSSFVKGELSLASDKPIQEKWLPTRSVFRSLRISKNVVQNQNF